jgi:hypothetical protein
MQHPAFFHYERGGHDRLVDQVSFDLVVPFVHGTSPRMLSMVDGAGTEVGRLDLGPTIQAFCNGATSDLDCVAIDLDDDKVVDSEDMCHLSAAGSVVDAAGCSIRQHCPCGGPRGAVGGWKSHAAYVSCISTHADRFASLGLIERNGVDKFVIPAAFSSCGKRRERMQDN